MVNHKENSMNMKRSFMPLLLCLQKRVTKTFFISLVFSLLTFKALTSSHEKLQRSVDEPNKVTDSDGGVNTGVISAIGIENIANHTYQGGQYTHLDDLLTPYLNWLAGHCLPLWLTTNSVTILGGLHILVAHVILCYQSPNMDGGTINRWKLVLTAYCIVDMTLAL